MKQVQGAVSEFVEARNTTKEALATKLGFGRSAFFAKLRGSNEFTLGEAYRLSRELELTLDEFYAMTMAEQ